MTLTLMEPYNKAWQQRDEIYRKMWRTLHEKALVSAGYSVPTFNAARKEVQGLAYNFQAPDLRATWLK